jgi:hypothetical protein
MGNPTLNLSAYFPPGVSIDPADKLYEEGPLQWGSAAGQDLSHTGTFSRELLLLFSGAQGAARWGYPLPGERGADGFSHQQSRRPSEEHP